MDFLSHGGSGILDAVFGISYDGFGILDAVFDISHSIFGIWYGLLAELIFVAYSTYKPENKFLGECKWDC